MRGEFEPPWTHTDWLTEAQQWIRDRLIALGRPAPGPVDQFHVRPWSTVLRVTSGDETVYFKAVMPELAHEPALTSALGKRFPDCTLPVIALDTARGWMLLPDAGLTLRELVSPRDTVAHWPEILERYAGVQQQAAPDVEALLALGVADRRLAALPGLFDDLLDDTEALRIGEPDGLTPEEHDQLQASRDRLACACRSVAASGVPETLCHEDFHDANVFLRDGQYLFTDWGECCIAHPFFTLLVTLRSTAYRLGVDVNAPEIVALRDAYLACWTQHATMNDMREAFDVAIRLAMVNRALSWRNVIYSLAPSHRGTDTGATPGWLQEYLLAEDVSGHA